MTTPTSLEPRVPVTGEARDQLRADLRRLYVQGASVRQIGESVSRSYGWAHKILTEPDEHGETITLRGRGGPNRRKKT